MIRGVIVDDHKIVVSGVKGLLEADPQMKIVAVASTMGEGVERCRELQPDFVILDLRMPDAKGPEDVAHYREHCPHTKIVVLTGAAKSVRDSVMRYGADAFLSKELASEDLMETVLRLCRRDVNRSSADLSTRERQVARMTAHGMSKPQIAEELNISVNTVKTHLAQAMTKLGVRDRVSLALLWRDLEVR